MARYRSDALPPLPRASRWLCSFYTPPAPPFREPTRPATGLFACLAAWLLLLVGGSTGFLRRQSQLRPPPGGGLFFSDYFPYLLQPFERAEVGFAVAASWLVLIVGRRWRPEPSWIDRCGRAVGAYWIMLVPIVRIGGNLNL